MGLFEINKKYGDNWVVFVKSDNLVSYLFSLFFYLDLQL